MKRSLKHLVYRCPGGVISIAALREVAEWAATRGDGALAIGPRQDIRLTTRRYTQPIGALERLLAPACDVGPNVTSTCASLGMARAQPWLTEGVYQELVESLPLDTRVSVGVSDFIQDLFPVATGEMVFVASEVPRYWHVALHDEFAGLTVSPFAIPQEVANDVVRYVEALRREQPHVMRAPYIDRIAREFDAMLIALTAPIPTPRIVQRETVGFYPLLGSDRCCVGIQAPDATYNARFVINACLLAQKHGIGAAHLTPWGGFIVKGIDRAGADAWRLLLGQFECAEWAQCDAFCALTDGSPAALKLKAFLTSRLRRLGRTAPSLSIAVQPSADHGEAALCIERVNTRLFARYRIRIRHRFDARATTEERVMGPYRRRELIPALVDIIARYHLGSPTAVVSFAPTPSCRKSIEMTCGACGSAYCADYGDPVSRIQAGTDFRDLPENWICPVCEAPKSAFLPPDAPPQPENTQQIV